MAEVLNMHHLQKNGINRQNLPDNATYIGRGSKWGNPFIIGKDGDRDEVVAKYRDYFLSNVELIDALPELEGQDLVCWCAPANCHGNFLIEMTWWLDYGRLDNDTDL